MTKAKQEGGGAVGGSAPMVRLKCSLVLMHRPLPDTCHSYGGCPFQANKGAKQRGAIRLGLEFGCVLLLFLSLFLCLQPFFHAFSRFPRDIFILIGF